MVRAVVAVVLLVAGTGWVPFAAGFALVKVMDGRQSDRQAFHNGIVISLVAAAPIVIAWFLILVGILIVTRRFPGLGSTVAALGGATAAGFVVSGAIASSLGGWSALVVLLVLPAAILVLLATFAVHPLLRVTLDPPVKPRTPTPPPA
jgi:MFS family permease